MWDRLQLLTDSQRALRNCLSEGREAHNQVMLLSMMRVVCARHERVKTRGQNENRHHRHRHLHLHLHVITRLRPPSKSAQLSVFQLTKIAPGRVVCVAGETDET